MPIDPLSPKTRADARPVRKAAADAGERAADLSSAWGEITSSVAGLVGQGVPLHMKVPKAAPRAFPAHEPRSPIGRAVWEALKTSKPGANTVDDDKTLALGKIEALWFNDADDHDEIMSNIAGLIREARHEVCIQSFIFDAESKAGQELIAALAAKQRENPAFRVNIVTDEAHPLELGPELERQGLKAHVVRFKRDFTREPLAAGLGELPYARSSDHSKSYVIDGEVAVVGGDNVDNWSERDVAIKVTGPIVDSLLADFDSAWREARVRGTEPVEAPAHHRPARRATPKGAFPLTIVGKRNEGWDSAADRALLAAFAAAKARIKIQTPNFSDEAATKAIAEAAGRGVKVTIAMPKDFNELLAGTDRGTNNDFLHWIGTLPAAQRANIEVRWVTEDGKKPVAAHTKFVAVDDEWAYIGSQNMDQQSWYYSREMGLALDEPAEVARLVGKIFDEAWEKAIPAEYDPNKPFGLMYPHKPVPKKG